MTSRRLFLSVSSTLAASILLGGERGLLSAAQAADAPAMMKRPIPSSGEMVPVIGMGTSGSFQISPNGPEYQALREVLKRFVQGGATLIDTAPTYGNAEDILGSLFRESGLRPRTFIATKLSGVSGKEAGLEQFRSTLKRLGTDKVELLHPELVTKAADYHVAVEMDSALTRGYSAMSWGVHGLESNARVIEAADAAGFYTWISGLLATSSTVSRPLRGGFFD